MWPPGSLAPCCITRWSSRPRWRRRTPTTMKNNVGATLCGCPLLGGHAGPPLRDFQFGEGGAGRLQCFIEVRRRVGGGEEGGLELGRGQVYPLAQHGAEELREGLGIGLLGRGVIGHRAGREEQRHHRAYPIERRRDPRLAGGAAQPVAQLTAAAFLLAVCP